MELTLVGQVEEGCEGRCCPGVVSSVSDEDNDGEVTMGGQHETSRAEQGHTGLLVAAVNHCSTA